MLKKNKSNFRRKLNDFDSFNYKKVSLIKNNAFGKNNYQQNKNNIKNINKKIPLINNTIIINKNNIINKKIIALLLFLVTALILTNIAFADLYLNSQTGSLILNTSSAERARITSGGLLGIGTATPDNLLTIVGNEITTNAILHLNTSDNFNTSVINVITLDHILKSPVNSTGGVGVSILFRATDNASQLSNIGNISAVLYNATNGSQLSALTFSTRGADTGDDSFGHLQERLRIDGYGRVGINTTSPNETLAVIGSLSVISGSDVLGLYQDSAGNIGIGTFDPNTKLEVNGTSTFGGDVNIPLNDLNVGGGYSSGGVSLVGSGGDKGSGQFAKNILLDGAIVAIYDVEINESFIPVKDLFSLLGNRTKRFLDLFVQNIKGGNETVNLIANVSVAGNLSVLGNVSVDGTTFFVDAEGNRVGIGKTSPNFELDVAGQINASAVNVTGTVEAIRFVGDGSLLTGLVTGQVWNASGSNVFLNDSTAKVGIGTASPDTKLKVSGDVNVTGTVWSQGTNITAGGAGGGAGGQWNGSGSYVYLNDSASKVGVGTATPQQKLTLGNESNLTIEMSIPTGITGAIRNVTGSTLSTGTFYYKITALDGAGGETAASAEISVTLAIPDNNASNITWSSVKGATSYRVYNASSSGGQKSFFNVTDTNFTHSGQAVSGNTSAPNVTTAYVAKISAVGDSWFLGGDVGIGTTTPDAKLKVSGDANVTGSLWVQGENITAGTNVSILYGDNGTDIIPLKVTSAGALELSVVETGTTDLGTGASGSDLTLTGDLTVDSPTFYVDSSNNRVGIGTSSPATTLDVQGNANVSGTLSVGSFELGNAGAGTMNVSGRTLLAYASGSVGIGTKSPDSKLHINASDTSNFSTTTLLTLDHVLENPENSTGGVGIGILFRAINNDSELVNVSFINASLVNAINGSEASTLSFYTRSGQGSLTPKLVLNGSDVNVDSGTLFVDGTNNRVGIGKTNPATSLDVSGTVTATAFSGDGSSLTGLITGQLWNGSGTNVYLNESTSKVGIGTSTPVETLSVVGNFSVTGNQSFGGGLTIGGDLISTGGLGGTDTTSSGWTDDGAIVRLIDATNKVGIGTTTPTELLVVAGNANVTGNLIVGADGSGNVGIGKTSPNFKLDVDGTINASGLLLTNGTFSISEGGKLGVGISAPTQELEVEGGVNISGGLNVTAGNVLLATSSGLVGIGTASPSAALDIGGGTGGLADGADDLLIAGDLEVDDDVRIDGGAITLSADTAVTLSGGVDGINFDSNTLSIDATNNRIGIGNAIPNNTLDVSGNSNFSGILHAGSLNVTGTVQATTFIGDGSSLTGISSATPPWNSSGGNVYLNDSTGSAGIGTSSPNYKLDVAGTVNASGLHIDGNANVTGTIFYGGNLTGYGADYAEMFESDAELENADVVCLDEYKKIDKCTKRADPSVIGVISTNPAIIGRNKFAHAYPVGLLGVVPTKVKGPVDRFSMLTTSDKVGYAEQATNADLGAMLGKAMEVCYEDECVIDVVVNLQ